MGGCAAFIVSKWRHWLLHTGQISYEGRALQLLNRHTEETSSSPGAELATSRPGHAFQSSHGGPSVSSGRWKTTPDSHRLQQEEPWNTKTHLSCLGLKLKWNTSIVPWCSCSDSVKIDGNGNGLINIDAVMRITPKDRRLGPSWVRAAGLDIHSRTETQRSKLCCCYPVDELIWINLKSQWKIVLRTSGLLKLICFLHTGEIGARNNAAADHSKV